VNRLRFVHLLRTIFNAQDGEVACSEFFELLPRYVDLVLAAGAGRSGSDALRQGERAAAAALPQVAQHIAQCAECGESYAALLEVERHSR
jgi:hypothetical protein